MQLSSEVDRLTKMNNKKMQEMIMQHQHEQAAMRKDFSAEREKLNKKIKKGEIALQKVSHCRTHLRPLSDWCLRVDECNSWK